jgi:MFS family permease
MTTVASSTGSGAGQSSSEPSRAWRRYSCCWAVVYPPSFAWGVVLLACFHFFQGAGPGALWALYIGELFPNRLRASGHGLATMSSRAGAVASSFMFQGSLVAWGLSATFVLHGSFAVLGLLLTVWLGVETKNRTLEAISGDEASRSREPAAIPLPERAAEMT